MTQNCPSCGTAQAAGTAFCGECGAPMTPRSSADDTVMGLPTERFTTPDAAALHPGAAAGGYAAAGHATGEAETTAYPVDGYAATFPEQTAQPTAAYPASSYPAAGHAATPYTTTEYTTTEYAGASPAGPAKTGPGRGVLLGLLGAALALLLGGFAAWTFLGRDTPDTPQAAAPSRTVVTVTTTPSASAPAASAPATTMSAPAATPSTYSATTAMPTVRVAEPDAIYRMYHRASGHWGPYTRVATLTDTTSRGFMTNVADAYAASGADGSGVFLSGVPSQAAGKLVDMSCNPTAEGFVRCTGGVNADVLLYR